MLKIQLLGIGCRRSLALRDSVMEALKDFPLDVNLEEVTDIDELMKFDVVAVPSLLINGQVVAENELLSADEIRALLEQHSGMEMQFFSPRRILVPVDFSDTSRSAFRFAQQLAADRNASLTVIHVYHPEFDAANPYMAEPLGAMESLKRELLDKFVDNNRVDDTGGGTATTLEVHREVRIGFAAEEIVRLGREEQFDLIIMGSTGEAGILEKVFGSVSIHVAQRSCCPVIFIPKDVHYRPFDKILYATNFQPCDNEVVPYLGELAKVYQAELHIVHIAGKNNGRELHAGQYVSLLPKEVRKLARLETIDTLGSVTEGLNQYVRAENIDLVVLGTQQRGLVDKILHRSVTKRVLINSKLPMMVLHYEGIAQKPSR
jgi:nucleotide-binding universal stress UspA family protein